jgi:hypothetical protein
MGKSKKNKSKGGVPSQGKKKVADEGFSQPLLPNKSMRNTTPPVRLAIV